MPKLVAHRIEGAAGTPNIPPMVHRLWKPLLQPGARAMGRSQRKKMIDAAQIPRTASSEIRAGSADHDLQRRSYLECASARPSRVNPKGDYAAGAPVVHKRLERLQRHVTCLGINVRNAASVA